MKVMNLSDWIFHDENVIDLPELAEIFPQPLLACLGTFGPITG